MKDGLSSAIFVARWLSDGMIPDLKDIRGRCLRYLEGARRDDGTWGYLPGQKPELEPTLFSVATGFAVPEWLEEAPEAWGLLLLPSLLWRRAPEHCERALSWILAQHSVSVEGVSDYDATLPAWSWIEGTAPWVEPTAWATMSLRRAGRAPERVAEGRRYLLDRQCQDGGWNYGNPRVNGVELESMVSPTAWAMLALRREPGLEPKLLPAAKSLDLALLRPGTPSLALAALARHAIGQDPGPFVEALAGRLGDEGARGRVDWTALAVLALDTVIEDRNAFV